METLQTPYGNVTAYINHVHTAHDNWFHISFIDSRNKLYVILMQESSHQWILSNEEVLPDWIIKLQTQFELMVRRAVLREQISSEV